jgi:alkylated DNA nucleotide flippase Atl1
MGPALQRTLLEEEGVIFDRHDRLNLEALYWEPGLNRSSSD